MNLSEYNAWAHRNLPVEEAMLGALYELFVIPPTVDTGFASHVLVNDDHVSIYTERGIIVEADFTDLEYQNLPNSQSLWWVSLSNIELHDDPIQFETLDDPYAEDE